MIECKGYAAYNRTDPLKLYQFKRRTPDSLELCMKVLYCGICHSDVFVAKSEWGGSVNYPCIPGHEIVGQVTQVGSNVKKFKIGDYAAVGCFVDSCNVCKECFESNEPLCSECVLTYNGTCIKEGYTKGGYSSYLVLKEKFAFTIPAPLHKCLAKVAPLLCAGITVFSPMIKYKMYYPGKKIGVVGLGGLGHMAVKFGKSFNNEVTVISTTKSKESDAKNILHADHFICSIDTNQMKTNEGSLDFIVYTAPNVGNLSNYIQLLAQNGTLVIVGLPAFGEDTFSLETGQLVRGGKSIAGSLVGGTTLTQEMLNYCGKNLVVPEIEIINIDQVNDAFNTLVTNDIVKYRYVIDIANSL